LVDLQSGPPVPPSPVERHRHLDSSSRVEDERVARVGEELPGDVIVEIRSDPRDDDEECNHSPKLSASQTGGQ